MTTSLVTPMWYKNKIQSKFLFLGGGGGGEGASLSYYKNVQNIPIWD